MPGAFVRSFLVHACALATCLICLSGLPASAASLLRSPPGEPRLHLLDPAAVRPLLALRPVGEAAADGQADSVDPPGRDDAAREPSYLWAGIFSAGVLTYNAVKSFTDMPQGGFHLADEGWFGRDTYAGGADKVSHFTAFVITSRELAFLYEHVGFTKTQAVLGGFAVSSLGGLVNELGDGTNRFGFSYEDLTMDVVGAGAAALNRWYGTEDLIGFRFGAVPGPKPPHDPDSDGFGKDYSNEIYTADLLFDGVARRLGQPRILRFLLASLTYGTRGYPYGYPDQRQQLVGFEVGLSFAPILDALRVRRDTWWGITAHILLDNLRVPYTQVGFRCDVHGSGCHVVNADGY